MLQRIQLFINSALPSDQLSGPANEFNMPLVRPKMPAYLRGHKTRTFAPIHQLSLWHYTAGQLSMMAISDSYANVWPCIV